MNWEKFRSSGKAFQKSRFSISLFYELEAAYTLYTLILYRAQDEHLKIQVLNLWMN